MTHANGHDPHPPPSISELARRSGYSRTHVRRLLKQGRTPNVQRVDIGRTSTDLDGVAIVKIRKDVHEVATTFTPQVQGAAHTPVDLVQLKRDIQGWTKLHQELNGAEAHERRQRIKDRAAQLTFLALGVAFLVGLAYAAVS